MEVVGAIVGSIVAKISEYAFEAVFNVRYNDNIKQLRVQVAKLESAQADVQNRIKEAELKAEDVYANVRDWMVSVDAKTHQANTFLTEIEDEEKKKCSFFNFNPRLRLCKKAKNMRIELALIQQLGQFGQVSCPAPLPAPIINVNDYLSFKSRETIMKDILEALQNPYIKMIGVYGMGGIGKTQLVKQISNQVTQSKLFELVILLTVGQRRDVNLVQQELAEMLRLPSHINTLQGRAALLQKRLHKAEKKMILVIFDDIWDFLDFETVGIPSGDDNKGCKILLTSRYKQVLTRKMGIKKIFEVKGLNEQESWELFKITVDDKSIENDREKMPIATEIVNKCGNLPLAIVIVGKALQGEPLYTWRDALRQLKDPANVEIEGVSKHVYTTLKWSYDHVKNPEAKSLFLLCSIFPDDHYIEIDELSTYAIGLKIIRGVDTLRTARDKILTMVDHLESSCLLQKDEIGSDGHQGVKMHDVVRDVAICIASTDNLMYTLTFMKGMDKWQDEKLRGGYTAIRVDFVGFEDLPLELSFPKLELLALLDKRSYREYNMLQIPEDYFGRMGRLKVLHLQEMCFSIPSSFDCLVNLRTLLLINCHLENIDTTGKLNNLEILDFSYSNVTELPLSLSQLSQLKQLKVSNCQQLEVIQPEVISRMTKLEELFLDNTFNDWEVGESNNCEQKKAKARISELGHLRWLTCVYLCIPDVRSLPEIKFLNNLELERFHIVIGKPEWGFDTDSEKALDIKTGSRNDDVLKELRRLLEKCEDLRLKGTCGVKNVVSKLKTSVHLTYLRLEDNEDVEYLVSELDPDERYCFKTLKVFEKLKTLEIEGCDKMKYLFPVSIIEGLSNLESIKVKSCEMMEAMVVVIENEAPIDNMEFKRLRNLELDNLPKLKSFCGILQKAKKGLIESKSSEIMELKEEEDRANSITPFHCQITFPNLESVFLISVENVLNDLLIGNNIENQTLPNLPEGVFRWMPKLKSLNLSYPPNLKLPKFEDSLFGDVPTT